MTTGGEDALGVDGVLDLLDEPLVGMIAEKIFYGLHFHYISQGGGSSVQVYIIHVLWR